MSSSNIKKSAAECKRLEESKVIVIAEREGPQFPCQAKKEIVKRKTKKMKVGEEERTNTLQKLREWQNT